MRENGDLWSIVTTTVLMMFAALSKATQDIRNPICCSTTFSSPYSTQRSYLPGGHLKKSFRSQLTLGIRVTRFHALFHALLSVNAPPPCLLIGIFK